MVDYTAPFREPLEEIFEVQNAGSAIYVAPLAVGARTPADRILTVGTAPTTGDEKIKLTSNQANGTWLRAGQILTFGANKVIVTASTLVATSATDVPVEALTAVPSGTTTVWENFQILSPKDIAFPAENSGQNRKDLTYGLQGSEVTTSVTFNPQIQAFVRLDDRGLMDHVFNGALQGKSKYCYIARNGGFGAYGRIIPKGFSVPGAVDGLAEASFTANYQAPYAVHTVPGFLTPEQKTAVNAVRVRLGIPIFA